MSNGNLNPETTLQQALDRSLVIQEQIDTLLNDPRIFIPSLPTNQRTQIACGLFGLTIDQAWSVTLLFQNKRYGAGLALTRPVLEACCRGKWIRYHAKVKTIETFSSNNFPDTRSLIKKTMSGITDLNGGADDFVLNVYRWLSDYTHGGVHMLRMQLSETGMASEYNFEEVRQALMVSDVMQIQAASELLYFARCKSDKYCQSLRGTHAQCERFQADMEKIRHLLKLLETTQ